MLCNIREKNYENCNAGNLNAHKNTMFGRLENKHLYFTLLDGMFKKIDKICAIATMIIFSPIR